MKNSDDIVIQFFFTHLKKEPFRNVEVVCFPHCVFSSLCFKNIPFTHCTLWIQHFDGFCHVASWYFISHCNFLFHRSNKTRFRCDSFHRRPIPNSYLTKKNEKVTWQVRKNCNVASDVIDYPWGNDGFRPVEKIPPASGTNQIAGFAEFRLLTSWEKDNRIYLEAWYFSTDTLFFYEHSFRGSLSSLESCHSGFSQLSVSTSASHSSGASSSSHPSR